MRKIGKLEKSLEISKLLSYLSRLRDDNRIVPFKFSLLLYVALLLNIKSEAI